MTAIDPILGRGREQVNEMTTTASVTACLSAAQGDVRRVYVGGRSGYVGVPHCFRGRALSWWHVDLPAHLAHPQTHRPVPIAARRAPDGWAGDADRVHRPHRSRSGRRHARRSRSTLLPRKHGHRAGRTTCLSRSSMAWRCSPTSPLPWSCPASLLLSGCWHPSRRADGSLVSCWWSSRSCCGARQRKPS